MKTGDRRTGDKRQEKETGNRRFCLLSLAFLLRRTVTKLVEVAYKQLGRVLSRTFPRLTPDV